MHIHTWHPRAPPTSDCHGAGQIVVLCIFHSRLPWQKGRQIQLHERDQYWMPKPVYTPASQVKAPSPPHFVERLHADATERSQAVTQPPRTCCLCGSASCVRSQVCERRPLAFKFPSQWKLQPKASAVHSSYVRQKLQTTLVSTSRSLQ
jgi:hypothetical protein